MSQRLILAWLIGVIVGASVLTSAVRSQNLFEQLVMPGPVVEGHAKLEKDCGKCHEPFSRKSQTRLCLDCHKDIAMDRTSAKGFHGRQADVARQECNHCHTDHKGRAADIVQFDRETLNHAFTNFELKFAHKAVACAGCHAPGKKFRKAPDRCFGCHEAKDPHKGRLGEKCDDCHNENKWREVKTFDHSATKFPLRGAHSAVACAACHVDERYKGVGTLCIDCHKIQDVHSGRYGTKCESCHDQGKWKTVHFDHDKTKYPLKGAHIKVRCDDCHKGDLYHDKLETTCLACHRKDDKHQGKLGNLCEQCHGEANWRRITAFDHDVTRFPLIGRHAVVACEECHRSLQFKGAPLKCDACHKDKHHEGRLGPNCVPCHNPNSWKRWRYDHDTQTRYPLTGAHRGLDCQACHITKNVTKATLPMDCLACHRQDDSHHGSFGPACERCHTTESFKSMGRRP